ncbi:TPA: IS1-like element transposase, partial [Escherichia coli]
PGTHQKIIDMAMNGVRLENGNYPTLRLFFVQSGIDCT